MNFFQFFVKYSIYYPLSADTSFKFLAIILFEIRHLQNFIPCLSTGRNLTRGDNSGKTRNTRRLFFHEESIHEVSRRYLEHEYVRTYVRTYGQAETNMSPTFSLTFNHSVIYSYIDICEVERQKQKVLGHK